MSNFNYKRTDNHIVFEKTYLDSLCYTTYNIDMINAKPDNNFKAQNNNLYIQKLNYHKSLHEINLKYFDSNPSIKMQAT